ncbi:MAG TPA: hypothetical protein VHB98_24415, partial [Chloroflexota bacterium]|nr:hypothetical protein [Chloroflexota bacterium]
MDGVNGGPTAAFGAGDAVAVKPGTRDLDSGEEISGWQGRFVGFEQADPRLAEIAWDSITLRGMRFMSLVQSEVEGL